jgi:hypothetical protein
VVYQNSNESQIFAIFITFLFIHRRENASHISNVQWGEKQEAKKLKLNEENVILRGH